MKKLISPIFILMFAVTIFFMASCSKDEGLNKPNSNASSSTLKTTSSTYSIVNNRFVFTNQTAFLNTLQYVFNNQSNQGLLSSIYLNTDFASMM